MLAALDREARLVQQLPLADRDVELVRLDHCAPAARRLQELEAEALAPRVSRSTWPVDLARSFSRRSICLIFTCALRAIFWVEARKRATKRSSRSMSPPRPPSSRLQPRGLLDAPRVPGAGEVRRTAGFQLEHRVAHGLEKPAVVRDDHDSGIERLQLALEPLEALDVEVVRRLVQQQQIGIAAERARERRARQLAAGERLQLAVEVLLGKTKPAQDRGGALAPVVAARVFEPRLRLRVAAHGRVPVFAAGHGLLEAAQLLLECDQVRGAREHVLAQRQPLLERRPLVVERDARPLLEREIATLEARLADERTQQRRLAGAVRPGERDAVAALHLERHAVEERIAAELLA